MKNIIEQAIFKVLDVNVKETRLVVEVVALITNNTEQDVVHTFMNLINNKRITLVSGGDAAYAYCSLYLDLNKEALAELAEKEVKAEVEREEALTNIEW